MNNLYNPADIKRRVKDLGCEEDEGEYMAGKEQDRLEPGLCRAGIELLPLEHCDSERRFLSADKLP